MRGQHQRLQQKVSRSIKKKLPPVALFYDETPNTGIGMGVNLTMGFKESDIYWGPFTVSLCPKHTRLFSLF